MVFDLAKALEALSFSVLLFHICVLFFRIFLYYSEKRDDSREVPGAMTWCLFLIFFSM